MMFLELDQSEAELLRVLLRSVGRIVVGAALVAEESGTPVPEADAKCTRAVMAVAPELLEKVEALIRAQEKGGN